MLVSVVRVFLVLVAWCLAASRPATAETIHADHLVQLDAAKVSVAPVQHQAPLIATIVEPFSLAAPTHGVLVASHVPVGTHTSPLAVDPSARGPPA